MVKKGSFDDGKYVTNMLHVISFLSKGRLFSECIILLCHTMACLRVCFHRKCQIKHHLPKIDRSSLSKHIKIILFLQFSNIERYNYGIHIIITMYYSRGLLEFYLKMWFQRWLAIHKNWYAGLSFLLDSYKKILTIVVYNSNCYHHCIWYKNLQHKRQAQSIQNDWIWTWVMILSPALHLVNTITGDKNYTHNYDAMGVWLCG